MKKSTLGIIIGIIALVVGIILGGFYGQPTTSNQNPEVNAGSVRIDTDQFVNGLSIGSPATFENWVRGTIPAGSNQASWRNNVGGAEVIVDRVILRTTGTASSTFRLISGTSTAATIADFTAPAFTNTAFIVFPFATSSTATTTNNFEGSGADQAAYGGIGAVSVADGGFVNFALLQGLSGTPSPGCLSVGSVCESATSTNRGFNVDYYLHYIKKAQP